jgi:hypothetical protein
MSIKRNNTILIEAESFDDPGGWVTDQQSMDSMGSPYLLAHGLGVPVENAETKIEITDPGQYNVWVRTRNWTAPWTDAEPPGRFQVLFNSIPLKTIFGTEKPEWHWQYGGTLFLDKGKNRIALLDLTGFDGRCDAIVLTTDEKFIPPAEGKALKQFRRLVSGVPVEPLKAGEFDLAVAGGGIAGITTAISAARLGCKVALIHDRPVPGGNNSSEVRVGLSGLIFQDPYPKLGMLVDEIGPVGHWTLWEAERGPDSDRSRRILGIIKNNPEKKIHNAGPAGNYEDEKKLNALRAERNIALFLNTHVTDVSMSGKSIKSVTGKNIADGREYEFCSRLFADCTGDGNLGYLAGADYSTGRESASETGESKAPEKADDLIMGTSMQWYAEKTDKPVMFPDCPWAVQFTEKTCRYLTRGDWDWETGFNKNQVDDIEYIRDYGLRAVYGNWSFLKNRSKVRHKYQNYKLSWLAYIGGKRESRRLLGDIILREQDIVDRVEYPDASFTTTWTIDLHHPLKLEGFNEEPFLSGTEMTEIRPYAVPYRCLYSRNIDNLFIAGRNISVTHVALGTVRVQRTTGMMGEVVGMAASLCKKYNVTPRKIYQKYLSDLKELFKTGVPPAKTDEQ